MKNFLKRIGAFIYIISSMGILMTAMVYPFALAFKDGPELWTCWIVYPLTLIVMATQNQMMNVCKKLLF